MADKKKIDLGMFEDRAVTNTSVAIRNAGDGLSKALHVDPQLIRQGDTVFVVLECEATKITFDPKGETECERIHVLKAGDAAIIDGKIVRSAIDAQKQRIIAAKEAENGIQQQWATGTEAGDLHAEHLLGMHVVAEPGCPDCPPAKADGAAAKAAPKKARGARKTTKKALAEKRDSHLSSVK